LHPELDRLIAVLDTRCRPTGTSGSVQATADILHLSDLHFGTLADARNFHSQIAQDLTEELGCRRLDGLICSGDLTQRSTDAEYAAAVEFLTLLAAEFALAPERMVLVPGNHDLSWDLAKAAYDPGRRADYDAADAQERRRWIDASPDLLVRDEARYRRRFDPFSTQCCEKVKGMPYPSAYPDQLAFHHWADLKVLVLGLNSAWEIDHHHRDRAGIHPQAVTQALNLLRATPDWADCLKIAVWHHPLASGEPSRIADHGFIERLAQAGFRLALHGHIHRAETGQYRYDQSPGGRRIDILAAGTFGAPSRDWVPGYPLQYNLLRLAGKRLTVETRRREEPNGAWKPDARWLQGPGKDPLPRYWVDI
jgi:3',5'-cyclic AMP phosphodiesterase CpdA